MIKKIIYVIFGLVISVSSSADIFSPNASYQVCFTPGENCTKLITKVIANAKRQILVQDFTFTSRLIADALVVAKKRHIDVKVILDQRQYNKLYAEQQLVKNLFLQNNIPVWLDYRVNTAHDKIIIVDGCIVETGSFNYTWGAQNVNSENLIIIHDCKLAQKYVSHWMTRVKQSKQLQLKKR